MKVLVTGVSGFVGSRLARLLLHAGVDDVFGVVRTASDARRVPANLKLVQGDLLTPGGMDEAIRLQPELCIHCAWYAEPGKYLMSATNVDLASATAHFGAALAARGCRRFVGVGTCFEYDTDAGYLAETSPLGPKHLYSAAKAAAFLMLRQLLAGTDTSFAWARLFYLFGPDEHPNRLVPAVIDALLRGDDANITKGEQVRDFLHVDDVATALYAIAQSDLVGAVNVGSGEPITVAALVENIGQLLGKPELIRLGARPYAAGDPMFVCSDNRRLRGTGWSRRYTLGDGLADVISSRRAALARSR